MYKVQALRKLLVMVHTKVRATMEAAHREFCAFGLLPNLQGMELTRSELSEHLRELETAEKLLVQYFSRIGIEIDCPDKRDLRIQSFSQYNRYRGLDNNQALTKSKS